MEEKNSYLESLDWKISQANISAISMLSKIRKRPLKERDMFIYNQKVSRSNRRDPKENLPPQDESVEVGFKDCI